MFIIWTFNNNDIILIDKNEISQLTNTAQEIIIMEQNCKHIILSHTKLVIIISSIIIITGVLIIIYGIIQWKDKVQKYEDKSRKLSNELLEQQIRNLTIEEKVEKVEKEIILNNEIINNKEIRETDISNNKSKIYEYMEIQKNVCSKIEKIFEKYQVFEEIKLEKNRYDCIALKTENSVYDYIFEIRYFKSIKSINRKFKILKKQIVDLEKTYIENTKRIAKLILIIIVDKLPDDKKTLINSLNENNMDLTNIIISDIYNIENDLKSIKKV